MSVARLFDRDRKHAKARKWLERAVALSPKLGDAWAHLYAFELQQAALGGAGAGAGEGQDGGAATLGNEPAARAYDTT